jgi:ABC-type Fe3+ transport system substrate-binding protein
VAVVAGAKHATIAQAYLELLVSREGQSVLARLGFLPPPAGAR